MKRVAVLVDAHGEPDDRRSPDDIVRWVSGNTGNLAFQTVVPRLLADDVRRVSWRDDPGAVARDIDVLIIPEASVLVATKDFGWKADFLEQTDLPLLAVGVGRQAELGAGPVQIPSGTRRYMRVLAERSHVICVRGERTAAELAALGIRNVEVLGCPSLFWSAGAPAAMTAEHPRLVIAPGPDRRNLRRPHRVLTRWAQDHDGEAIVQSGRLLKQALGGATHGRLNARRLAAPASAPVRLRAFLHIPTWIEFLSRFDVCISARIHGAILAVGAGVPAVCITHDDRTRELAETSALPVMQPTQVNDAPSVCAFLDAVSFDWDAHMQVRRSLAVGLMAAFARYGLAPSDHLNSIATGVRA